MPRSTPSAAALSVATKVPTVDKLDRVRNALRRWRDLAIEKRGLEERLSELSADIAKLEFETLPTIFNETGIDKLGLQPEGNLPGYAASLKAYYKASIPADWDDERKARAFEYLEKQRAGDLIKTTITVELGRGEREIAKRIERDLKKLKVSFSRNLTVPWNTLTAWLRSQVEDNNTMPVLDLIGATVGEIVKPKQTKQEN